MGVFLIDFILMIMNFGKLNTEGKKNRIYLEGKEFRLIVTTEWYGKSKQLLLTAFDLRPISRKNPQRAKETKKAPKRQELLFFVVISARILVGSILRPALFTGQRHCKITTFPQTRKGDGLFFSFYRCSSSHVMPAWIGALAGIYGCGLSVSSIVI